MLRSLPRVVREWMLDRVSVRLRLALWYAGLLFITLMLFSVIVYGVAQSQLEASVDTTLQHNAQVIAGTVQDALSNGAPSSSQTTPSATSTPAARPTATAAISSTPTASPNTTPGATVAPTTTLEPTPNPQQQKNVQQSISLSHKVPAILGQIDLTFMVLDAGGAVDYHAPNITATSIPRNNAAIQDALQYGVCQPYTAQQNGSTFRVYVYPITYPSNDTNASASTSSTGTLSCQSPTSHAHVVGAVLMAKTLDDMNSTLATLRELLAIGVFVAVIFTSLGGWLLAGNGLRPIASVTRTARAIAVNAHAAGLGRRVDYRGPRDEVGELASTFDDMLAAIERVSNAQRRFVADASHELRAPLTTIKSSLEFLRRAQNLPEDERSAVLEDAYTEAERMTTLVNDLLLLARADAAASGTPGSGAARLDDQMRGRREQVELDQLALDIFRHARAQLQARRERGIQIAIENLEPEVVLADPGQIRQVLLILLDNAIKYTPSGGKVRISVTRQGTRAAVSISDTGIGIEPEVRPHIFDRFFRGDQARERDEHGSGLGLAIAKWIVDAHQGEISVYSQPGKGSTFTVLLPATKRIGEQTSAKQPALPARSPRPSRSVVAGAISPLARWAENVSRPRATKAPRRKPARDGHAGTDTGKSPAAKPPRGKHQRPTVPPKPSMGKADKVDKAD